MKIEFNSVRDLLYFYFDEPDAKTMEIKMISPGVHVDFNKDGKLISIE